MREDHGSSTTSTRETRAHAECDEDDVDRSNSEKDLLITQAKEKMDT